MGGPRPCNRAYRMQRIETRRSSPHSHVSDRPSEFIIMAGISPDIGLVCNECPKYNKRVTQTNSRSRPGCSVFACSALVGRIGTDRRDINKGCRRRFERSSEQKDQLRSVADQGRCARVPCHHPIDSPMSSALSSCCSRPSRPRPWRAW